MSVKSYKWPFKINPHTLLVRHDEAAQVWEFAVCNETTYLRMVPGLEPEIVTKTKDNKILKKPLELVDS